MLLYVKFKL